MTEKELQPQSNRCVICGSDCLRSFAAHSPNELSVQVNMVECMKCHFAWQYPLQSDVQQGTDYFEKAYEDSGQRGSQYFDPERKRKIAALEYQFVSESADRCETLLDVGAGAGIFAEVAAENGCRVTAVDPALSPAQFSADGLIRGIRGMIDDIPDGETFDVVTLWDVIEHATQPRELIAQAKARLQVGGWLFIETGNYKSVERASRINRHWIFQLDHRWYFSPSSMRQLLLDAGFADLKLSARVLRPDWNGTADYGGPSRLQLAKAVARNPFRLSEELSRFRYLRQATGWEMSGLNIFAIAARKPE